MNNVLIFGSSGSLGGNCVSYFKNQNWNILTVDRSEAFLNLFNNLDSLVWAQGSNLTAPLLETSGTQWNEIWDSNFIFIIKTLKSLINSNSINEGARLVIISSVWGKIARKNKSAYISSKAAVGGLIRAMACELRKKNISINEIMPGIISTSMTQNNLSKEQIAEITKQNPNGKLVKLEGIARIVEFFASDLSRGISGQSIMVENAWSISRNV
jgi:NAD(P)-dependent dehydrogenase (short-subunit alcohol dehydrogenase family)